MQILCTKKFLSVFPSSPQQQLKSGLQVSTLALSGDKPGTYMYCIKLIVIMTYLFNIYLEAVVLLGFKFRLHKFEQLSAWFTVSKWTFCVFEVVGYSNIAFHSSLKWQTPVAVWSRKLECIICNVRKVMHCQKITPCQCN